jgi:UDP-glucose 4-epimerase
MRILVTGSSGFIGRHVVQGLALDGHHILSTSRAALGPPQASQHIPHDFARHDPFPSVGPLDAIVHLAGNGNALASWDGLAEVAQTNAQGTLHALQVAARSRARFILASTQRIYQPRPEPLTEDAPSLAPDPYGYTKLAAELYVEMAGRLLDVPGAILRFFSVYGPGQQIQTGQSGVAAILGQRAIEGKPLLVLSHQKKDFVEVSDAVEAIRRAIERPSMPARAYNIATGVPTTVLELAVALREVTRSRSEIVEDYREGDPGALVANISRAQRELGFEPRIPLEEGLRRYVDWLLSTRAHSAESASDTSSAR